MKCFLAATAVVLLAGSTAFGQVGYVTMMPIQPVPVVTYSPYMAPPMVGPVVQYAPRYYVASPVLAPAPMVMAPPYAVAGPPVYYGPRVWVHPKVYVAGEPVRNILRAVTP
jgi:hypothetical protein